MKAEFQTFIELHSAYIEGKTVNESYRPAIQSLIDFIGDKSFADVTTKDLMKWITYLKSDRDQDGNPIKVKKLVGRQGNKKNGEPIFKEIEKKARTPRGINSYIRAVRAVASFLAEQNEIPKTCPVLTLKELPKDDLPIQYLTEAQLTTLFEKENQEMYRQVYAFAFLTGLRLSDVSNLRWDYIDLRANVLHCPIMKTGRRLDVPLHPMARLILDLRTSDSNSVEYVWGAKPLRPTSVTHRFKFICRKAELPDVHFHILRKSFASHLAMAGVAIHHIAKLLGHCGVDLAIKTYAGLSPSSMSSDLQHIGQMFLTQKGNGFLALNAPGDADANLPVRQNMTGHVDGTPRRGC